MNGWSGEAMHRQYPSGDQLFSPARWHFYRAWRKLTHLVYRPFYRDANGDPGKSAILAGMGRSGTTWLAELITAALPCRLIWEPFNPHGVKAYGSQPEFWYLDPGDAAGGLLSYIDTIRRGKIRERWLDREISSLRFEYRLIKTIRANLFLKWLQHNLPTLALLFMIRHPCAVVLSRLKAGWRAEPDLAALMGQPALVSTYLQDKLDIIQSADTPVARHALLWAIQNLIPYRQFQSGELRTVFYENLVRHPEVELPRAFRALGFPFKETSLKRTHIPSRSSLPTSASRLGNDPLVQWQRELTKDQIQTVLSIVDGFGLGHLYGAEAMPLSHNLHG